MDKLKKYQSSTEIYSFFWIAVVNLLSLGGYLLIDSTFKVSQAVSLSTALVLSFILSYGVAKLLTLAASQPLKAVWQAIWHISPGDGTMPAPNTDKLTHGRNVADVLVQQIYSLGSSNQATIKSIKQTNIMSEPTELGLPDTTNIPDLNGNVMLIDIIPLPVVALDNNGNVIRVNKLFSDYTNQPAADFVGKSLGSTLSLNYSDKSTLETWLDSVKDSTITADKTWDRVSLNSADNSAAKQFDMVGHFSKDSQNGYETLLAIVDHTERYSSEDTNTSYVALAVHELRTPLTVLRGYIEVIDDELGPTLTPELKEFMGKMSASAQTLTAFVSNILNVARVDDNQLDLTLREANWNELLPEICRSLELRAKVRGKTLELDVAPGLPAVGIDKISIYEVVSNLVENAIKYSGDGQKIIIHASLTREGDIQTTVQDFGLGIPESVIGHLFTKFYRSHRSKSQVGGTGLGLYLVKAIVSAHGGEVSVQSKEGEGSSFGFTLKPYASLSSELSVNGSGIEHHAHGWIKNHSTVRK